MDCVCHNISLEEIAHIAKERGLTIEQLQQEQIACTRCKLCVPYLLKMGINKKAA